MLLSSLPLMLKPITFSHFAYLMTSNTLTWAALAAVVLVLASRTNAAPLPFPPDRIRCGAGGSVGGLRDWLLRLQVREEVVLLVLL